MIKIHRMYHHEGKIIFQDVAEEWYEVGCVVNDLVADTYGDLIIRKIENPEYANRKLED